MDYPSWISEAEALYKEKKSFTKIGSELKVNRKLVSYYLKKLGYESHFKDCIRENVIQKTRKNVNEDAFEVIDNEEKAYWLGFMYADGCVYEQNNRIELSLQEKDYEHIVKFKKFMQSDHIIGKKVKDNTYVSYRIAFNSKKIKTDLITHGCIPNKTRKITFPELDNNLVKHFIRGYLDADGCITNSRTSKTSVEILGCEDFLISLAKHFNIEGHIYRFNHSDIKRFMIAGKKAREILEYLYGDATIYLDRKYEKYLEHCRLETKPQKSQDD